MRECVSDIEFHQRRARAEREIAYRSADARAAGAHMKLSALHLQRALTLQAVRHEPVGNVSPLRTALGQRLQPGRLPSCDCHQ